MSKKEDRTGQSNSFSHDEIRRLLEMFSLLDQGRDVKAYIGSKPIRSLRGKFQRMRDKLEGHNGGESGKD